MERGVCVRACAHVTRGRGCMGPGKRMTAHTHPSGSHEQSCLGCPGAPTLEKEPITLRHLPELLPLPLGSGKVEKKGDSEAGQ